MRIILERNNDLKTLEADVNKKLEELENAGAGVRGITYATHTVPKVKNKEIVDHDIFYSVMIAYTE